jgi:protein TonB
MTPQTLHAGNLALAEDRRWRGSEPVRASANSGWSEPPEPAWERVLKFGLIAGLHAALIGAVATLAVRPEMIEAVKQITVSLIEERPPELPKIEPARPLPPTPRPVIRREPPPPQPVMTAPAEAPAPAATFSVAPQPPALPPEEIRPAPPPPAPPAPLVAARFDADYLHNPKPVYPAMSRKLGEQGRVILQVRVLADGRAARVSIRTASGYPRLDEAALEVVTQWRFVPARRGDEAVESTVLVPITFALDR